MEINNTVNIAVIISSIIAVAGWLVNSHLSRKHEIAKKRLEYRLETLHSFVPVFIAFDLMTKTSNVEKDFYNKLNTSHLKFQLYGNQNEIDIFNDLMKSIDNNDSDKIKKLASNLMNLTLNEIRNELKLPKIK